MRSFYYKKENYYISDRSFWRFYDAASEIEGDNTTDLLKKLD